MNILEFIKFIDRYPTCNLSIEIIKYNIVKYYTKSNVSKLTCNDAIFSEYIKKICHIYKLNLMYLYIHAKFVIDIINNDNL